MTRALALYFSDFFKVDPKLLANHGAFNVSLLSDLPLFIDPFLLFNSSRPEYQELHANILKYMSFLRDKVENGLPDDALLKTWFVFREVKQTWLGFSRIGNSGSGLGLGFAKSLVRNMGVFFDSKVARAKHLEKLCLIDDGVGRDNISDFTTNLIKDYLIAFTQDFAMKHLAPSARKQLPVARARFNYDTEVWEPVVAELPYIRGDFVLLTPTDILTKDETWISRVDLVNDFTNVIKAVESDALRAQLNNYLAKCLPQKKDGKGPTRKEFREAVSETIREFPVILDYYVRKKEDSGDAAEQASARNVEEVEATFIRHVQRVVSILEDNSTFYAKDQSDDERLRVLLEFSQGKGRGLVFRDPVGAPFRLEPALELVLKLIWQATSADDTSKQSPCPVQFKLARNAKFGSSVQNRSRRYSATVVVAYGKHELKFANDVLAKLSLGADPSIRVVEAQ